jgi:glutamyl-tRNA reductase
MDTLFPSMHILIIGLNHKAAPVEVRERLAFGPRRISHALNQLLGDKDAGIEEAVLLSTCNRIECYVCTGDTQQAEAGLLGFLARYAGMETAPLKCMVYTLRDEQAAEHLMRVATGLDSLVLGENEILGQVRCAAELAQSAGATGPILSTLFRYAIQAGKRTRAETVIGQGKISVASVVVELAEQTFGRLHERTALLIGAGKISAITARALTHAGLHCIMVANRTYEKAEKLAKSLNGTAVHFDRLDHSLLEADIVICSTGAPHILLHADTVEKAQKLRHGRPLLVADLSVPRDADPNIAAIRGVTLVNIDDLDLVAKTSHAIAAPVCQQVEAIIQEELSGFHQWCAARRCVPLIQALHDKAESIYQIEVENTLRRLGPLTPQQERMVQAMGKAIAGKLLHEPTVRLRELAQDEDPTPYLELFQELYGI